MSFQEPPKTYQEVPNHLVKAILVTLFCCLPFGVIAIVFAAQVNSQVQAGNTTEALRLSNQANTWGNVGMICGLIPIVLYVILMLIGVASGVAANA